MIVSPTPTTFDFGTRSRTSTSLPPPPRLDRPRPPSGSSGRSRSTALWLSVSSVTRATLARTRGRRCRRDRRSTDRSRRRRRATPSFVPAAIVTLCVDRALRVRRAPRRAPGRSRRSTAGRGSSAPPSAARSPARADSSRINCCRSVSTWARSFLFSDFASTRPCAQPTASRKGRETRSAATSNGRRIAARRALHAVERARAERDRDQDEREQHKAAHDDPALEGAGATRGVAGGGGALDGGAQDRKTDGPVARHALAKSSRLEPGDRPLGGAPSRSARPRTAACVGGRPGSGARPPA